MKKNKMMRIASVLLVAVLLSTCAISGTFAKYVTTGNAGDSARVAKWGITVEVTGNEAFATKYHAGEADTNGTDVVSGEIIDAEANTLVNVVAPGTNGTLATVSISGTPEVAYEISATADLALTGSWVSNAQSEIYCPIVFTVGNTEIDGTDYATLAALETAVENAVREAIAGTENGIATKSAGDAATTNVTVTWEWKFEVDPDTNLKDSYLGNWDTRGDTKPEIQFSIGVNVAQTQTAPTQNGEPDVEVPSEQEPAEGEENQ